MFQSRHLQKYQYFLINSVKSSYAFIKDKKDIVFLIRGNYLDIFYEIYLGMKNVFLIIIVQFINYYFRY